MKKDFMIELSLGGSNLAEIRNLRYEVLRKPLSMPHTGTIFPGDTDQSTVHVLARHNSELIGCATLLIDDFTDIQLRGMAVTNEWQGHGVGKSIVDSAKNIAIENNRGLWCNARFLAIGFYERQGWMQYGEFFEVPIIGPHVVMKWARTFENIA